MSAENLKDEKERESEEVKMFYKDFLVNECGYDYEEAVEEAEYIRHRVENEN